MDMMHVGLDLVAASVDVHVLNEAGSQSRGVAGGAGP